MSDDTAQSGPCPQKIIDPQKIADAICAVIDAVADPRNAEIKELRAALNFCDHLRNRLWQQASVVAGYYRPDRPDTEFVSVCNDDLRKLDEVAHGPLPNAPNEGAEVACDILTRDDGIRICPKCNGMWSPQYEVVCPRNSRISDL
jgi:hypothetical protein